MKPKTTKPYIAYPKAVKEIKTGNVNSFTGIKEDYLDLVEDYTNAIGIIAMAFPLIYGGDLICNKENFKPLIENFLNQNK